MARPRRDMAPIYQRLADGCAPKEIAADMGITANTLNTCLNRHRRRIGARTQEHAVAVMIASGKVIARRTGREMADTLGISVRE